MTLDDRDDNYEDDFEDYEDDFEEDATLPVPQPTSAKQPWCVISLADLSVGDLLAQGAMGAIHAATWRGQRVAVKTLHDTSAAVLASTEAELLMHAALDHPNIVTLHGANLNPPGCCIVMERCSSSLFEKLHKQRGDFDRRSLVGMAIQIAEGLSFLHSRSPPLVHRDVKSHNVLLAYSGDCKLCDFGLINAREVTAGTPNYMAPELFLSKPHGVSVDTFAFGVLLNEMFSREVPWDGYQPFDIKERVVKGERPPTPRTMPHACEGLLRKAWHQHASLRPRIEQVVTTLQSVEQNLPQGLQKCSRQFNDSLDTFASIRLGSTI